MDIADVVKEDFSVAKSLFATTVQNDGDHGPGYSACRGLTFANQAEQSRGPPTGQNRQSQRQQPVNQGLAVRQVE